MNALYELAAGAYAYVAGVGEKKVRELPPHESEVYGYLLTSYPGYASSLRIPGWGVRVLLDSESLGLCLRQVVLHPRDTTFPEDIMGIRRDALASHLVVIRKAEKPRFLQQMRDKKWWYQCVGEDQRFFAYALCATKQPGVCFEGAVIERVNVQQDMRCLTEDFAVAQLSITWNSNTPPATCLERIEEIFEKFYLGSPDKVPGPMQHRFASAQVELMTWNRPQFTVQVWAPPQTIDMLVAYLKDDQIYFIQCTCE